MSELITGINTCRLCRQTVHAAGLQIRPDNPSAHNAAAQASLALMQHVMQAHTKIDGALQTQAAQFLGMLRLTCYKLSDPAVERQRDYLRWYVHQSTLTAQISDAKMKDKAAALAQSIVEFVKEKGTAEPDQLADTIATLIAGTLGEMRNALQEPGKYPNGPENLVRTIEQHAV